MELTDDAKDGETRGISVETNGKVGVEVTEDGSGSKATFEFLEGFLSLGRPMEVLVFPKKR